MVCNFVRAENNINVKVMEINVRWNERNEDRIYMKTKRKHEKRQAKPNTNENLKANK